MPGKLVRVQEKGQVTLPVEVRRRLNLNKGDLVAFVETAAGVVITKREAVASEALDRIGETLRAQGVALPELSGNEVGKPESPQSFYQRFTSRDDVAELMRRLAK